MNGLEITQLGDKSINQVEELNFAVITAVPADKISVQKYFFRY